MGNDMVKVVKVYPKFHIFKGMLILGGSYMVWQAGRFFQKLIDGYDIKNGTISFEKKDETHF